MKSILITGGEGMVGKELRDLLHDMGEEDIKILDIKNGDDIRDYDTCKKYCEDVDEVYHLFGIKGSPKMTQLKPLSFMEPMIQGDSNMIRAARECGVKKFVYTSSITVYYPEADVYPSWTKKTAEKLIEATRIEYPNCKTKYAIVRPASIYGKYDDYERDNPMVIPSMIKSALNGKLELVGEGMQTRDFINAKDVALGMIKVMEEMPGFPVNLGSGKGVTIHDLIKLISKQSGTPISYISANNFILGAESRVMERNWDNPLTVDLDSGLKEVIEWVKEI